MKMCFHYINFRWIVEQDGPHLLESLHVLGDGEFGVRLLLDLVHGDTGSQLRQSQTSIGKVDLENALSRMLVGKDEKQNKTKHTRSVMMVLTTLAPVNGRAHS